MFSLMQIKSRGLKAVGPTLSALAAATQLAIGAPLRPTYSMLARALYRTTNCCNIALLHCCASSRVPHIFWSSAVVAVAFCLPANLCHGTPATQGSEDASLFLIAVVSAL